jgi:hypothetical protein
MIPHPRRRAQRSACAPRHPARASCRRVPRHTHRTAQNTRLGTAQLNSVTPSLTSSLPSPWPGRAACPPGCTRSPLCHGAHRRHGRDRPRDPWRRQHSRLPGARPSWELDPHPIWREAAGRSLDLAADLDMGHRDQRGRAPGQVLRDRRRPARPAHPPASDYRDAAAGRPARLAVQRVRGAPRALPRPRPGAPPARPAALAGGSGMMPGPEVAGCPFTNPEGQLVVERFAARPATHEPNRPFQGPSPAAARC